MCCEAWEWRMSDFSHLRSAMISRNALPKVSYCYYCMEIILEKVTPMGIIRYEWLRPEPGLQDATMGKPQFPLHLRDASVLLPNSIPQSSHRLPGLESTKEVKVCAPPAHRLETLVLNGLESSLSWKQILQILLLVLLELLSPFCFFYKEKWIPLSRAETKWCLIYTGFVFNNKEVSENLQKQNFKKPHPSLHG